MNEEYIVESFLKVCKSQVNLRQIIFSNQGKTKMLLRVLLAYIFELPNVQKLIVDKKYLSDYKDGRKLHTIFNKRIQRNDNKNTLPVIVAVAKVNYFKKS